MSRQTTKTSKKKLNRTRLAIVALAVLTVLAGTVLGGNLDQTLPPTNPNTAMYTLLDIYNRLTTNATAAKRPGAFTEPSSGPPAAESPSIPTTWKATPGPRISVGSNWAATPGAVSTPTPTPPRTTGG